MGRAKNSAQATQTGSARRTPTPNVGVDRYFLQNNNRPIGDLLGTHERIPFDLDPPYQRGHVWEPEQQRNLILSVVQGLPVGAVFINARDIMEPYRIVDGKQRLTALIDFTKDRFSVPADWFPDVNYHGENNAQIKDEARDKDEIVFSDLTDSGRRKFENFPISSYETKLKTEAEEAELYLRINFGGTTSTDEDQARAQERVAAADAE